MDSEPTPGSIVKIEIVVFMFTSKPARLARHANQSPGYAFSMERF